ncbi:M56 family metallopeptidase [Lysobacter hankyongensis]|uniref:Peptidase M56 domain-containing protein n=1 Tax=Lysobacter hankyongensis TaxID=1176535 RepID=A0ABP9AUE1_9GAMM
MTNDLLSVLATTLTTALVPALAQGLLHFLWQGAAIGASAWLILWMLRTARPQARYAVACIALAACLWLPLQTLRQGLQPATAPTDTSPIAAEATADAVAPTVLATLGHAFSARSAPLDAATPWVVALWGVGVGAMLLRLLAGLSWLRRARRAARLPVPEIWQSRWRALCARMQLDDRIRLLISDDDDGPLSAGIFRPVVIVPAALLARMPAELLEALLAHELAHIRRHDYLVNLLQTLVESLLFYHPAVWWLSHRIRIERELIADDIAANALGEPRRLALALSALDRHAAATHPHATPALAQAAQGGHLMTRIQQLIRPTRPGIGARIALPAVALLATGVACYAYAQADRAPLQAAQRVQAERPAAASPTIVAAGPRGVVRTGAVVHVDSDRAHEGYALVNGDSEKLFFSGDTDQVDDVRAAQAALDGDFLWFNHDGKAYVLRDPAVLARVQRAWAASSASEAKMEAMSREMETHSQAMEAMSRQMSALGENMGPSREMQESNAQLQHLAMEQAKLAQRQAELAIGADTAAQAAAELEIERRMDALDLEIERISERIDAEAEAMTARAAPMEALGEKMESAARPMEALGAEMEALGEKMEREMAAIDSEIRGEIERAVREGRAEPAPTRQ